MNTETIMVIIGFFVLATNCTTMFLTFSCRRSLPFSIFALVLFTVAFYATLNFVDTVVPDKGGLPGLAYLPIMLLLFEGRFFQKVFAYFLQFLLTSFQVALAETIGGLFLQYGEQVSFAVFAAVLLVMLSLYIALVFKHGRRFFERLFENGQRNEWVFYAIGAVFSFAVLAVSQIAPGSAGHIIFVLFYILWSFAILCFAVINTHEKLKHKYEAELARDIISSGSDHYQKMNEMFDTLRVLRHDYQYHLDVIGELLSDGNKTEAENYLTDIQQQFPKDELRSYCSNPVLNALLAAYNERCRKHQISFDVEVSMPETLSVPNYEMCIVIGNLLENAVEAVCRCDSDRKIELRINTQGTQFALMVKNGYIGRITDKNGLPASTKAGGGFGLRSVQAVTSRHGGELMTEWDDATFTTYVLMRM